MSSYSSMYLAEVSAIADQIDIEELEHVVSILAECKANGGRLFFLGVGGGAGHASHAVNDFRKICGIECYTPIDNVSELTARINDDGWETAYSNWLRVSRLSPHDVLFVFSVGGGNIERKISMNIVAALQFAKQCGARIVGVVGREGGYTKINADACIVVPVLRPETVTQQTESFQAVLWHLMVGHPKLKENEMKWEQLK